MKNFIPLTENGRFNLFNITGVGLTIDRTTTESVTQDVLTRKYDNGYTFRLGITPGMQVFVIDGFAAELGVNIAGVSTSTTTSTINGVQGTKVHAADLDLTLNILSLNITFFYFIDLQKK
jgi:C-terminal processing protease CtpA/Prc